MSELLPSNERSLLDRLLDAQVTSCSCLTKSPEVQYHDPMCRYRLFDEAHRTLSRQSVTMNGFQARMVLKFIDGDDDCSLEVAELPERTASNGEHMAAGLYVWLSDYPEEGCLLLTEEPTAEGFCAEPKQVETTVSPVTRETWMGWADEGSGWLAAIHGSGKREDIEWRIERAIKDDGSNRYGIRPIRVTLHVAEQLPPKTSTDPQEK